MKVSKTENRFQTGFKLSTTKIRFAKKTGFNIPKHNGLEGREKGDGVINWNLAKSDRKPISGHRASNRKGTALPSGSPQAENNKFHLRGRAATAAELDLHGGATELTQEWRG